MVWATSAITTAVIATAIRTSSRLKPRASSNEKDDLLATGLDRRRSRAREPVPGQSVASFLFASGYARALSMPFAVDATTFS
jgi:hypothetical protein